MHPDEDENRCSRNQHVLRASTSSNKKRLIVKNQLYDDSNTNNDGMLNTAASCQNLLSKYATKGLSLGYDLSVVTAALRQMDLSYESMSKFVEVLINCEEEQRYVTTQRKRSNDYRMTLLANNSKPLQFVLDGMDIITTYHKINGHYPLKYDGLRIAYEFLDSLNFGQCIVVLSGRTPPSAQNGSNYDENTQFLQSLLRSNRIISSSNGSRQWMLKVIDAITCRQSIILTNGSSKLSLLKFKDQILSRNTNRIQIEFASFDFDGNRFFLHETSDSPNESRPSNSATTQFRCAFDDNNGGDSTCPYGTKCTYGNKCKFSHPERGYREQISLSEQIAMKAAVEKDRLKESLRQKGSLMAVVHESSELPVDCKPYDSVLDALTQNIGRFKVVTSPDEDTRDRTNHVKLKINNETSLYPTLKIGRVCSDYETASTLLRHSAQKLANPQTDLHSNVILRSYLPTNQLPLEKYLTWCGTNAANKNISRSIRNGNIIPQNFCTSSSNNFSAASRPTAEAFKVYRSYTDDACIRNHNYDTNSHDSHFFDQSSNSDLIDWKLSNSTHKENYATVYGDGLSRSLLPKTNNYLSLSTSNLNTLANNDDSKVETCRAHYDAHQNPCFERNSSNSNGNFTNSVSLSSSHSSLCTEYWPIQHSFDYTKSSDLQNLFLQHLKQPTLSNAQLLDHSIVQYPM